MPERGRAEHRVARARELEAEPEARRVRVGRTGEREPVRARRPRARPRSPRESSRTPSTSPSTAAYMRASERASVTALAAGISAARAARVLKSRPIGNPSSICGATRGSRPPAARSTGPAPAARRSRARRTRPRDSPDTRRISSPTSQPQESEWYVTAVPGSHAGRIRARARTQRSKSSGSAGTKPASPAVWRAPAPPSLDVPRTPASTPPARRQRPAPALDQPCAATETTPLVHDNDDPDRIGAAEVDHQLAVAIDRELRRARVIGVRRRKRLLDRQISAASASGRSIGTNA